MNRDYWVKKPGLVIVGIVKHKDSVSILKGESHVFGITLKSKNGKLYLVKKPENDLELAIIETSFSK